MQLHLRDVALVGSMFSRKDNIVKETDLRGKRYLSAVVSKSVAGNLYRQLLVSAATVALAVTVRGFEVSNVFSLQTNANCTITAVAEAAAYPADIGEEPLFWFDASNREGWEFSDEAKTKITKIPSKTGPRYLTTDQTGGHFNNWFNTYAEGVQSPVLVSDDPVLKPGCAVDFGALSSKRGLVFDPEVYPEGATASNSLRQIGTVIAVYGSQNGGGWLMGGGASGYAWHRTTPPPVGGGDFSWSVPLFYGSTSEAARYSLVRHDGHVSRPQNVGFNRSWEVLSVITHNSSSTGTAHAWGLGINDARANMYMRSGGMKIAEMLIFQSRLDVATVAKIEAYLQKKWFDRAERGVAGNAHVGELSLYGNNQAATVEVPASTTLTVDELQGGRGASASLTKTGAGTLKLSNAERYGGVLKLNGGKLEWDGKSAPAEADLPHDLFLRFDASDLSRLVTETDDGIEYVRCWNSQVAGTFNSKPLRAVAKSAGVRPVLRRDALGTGLHALDFLTVGAGGACLTFTTDLYLGTYAEASCSAPGVATVVAVVNAQNGGGVQLVSGNGMLRGGRRLVVSQLALRHGSIRRQSAHLYV